MHKNKQINYRALDALCLHTLKPVVATHLVTFHRHTHQHYFSFSEMINIASYTQFVHLLFSFMLHNTQSSIKKETCLKIYIWKK